MRVFQPPPSSSFQHRAGVVAFVGDEFGRRHRRRRAIDFRQVRRRRLQRVRQRRRVAVVRRVDLGRDDGAGIEIDGVFRLVGQMRGTVLHPGDLRLGIGPAHPIPVGQLLALPCPVQANEIVGRGRLDAALLSHPLQHLPVGLARVPAHDRPQRGVRLHGRGIDADPLALDQTMPGDQRQHPAEHRLVNLIRQPASRLRQPGVIRHPLRRLQAQKFPERERVRTPPFHSPLGVDALEVADHVHPEVPAGEEPTVRPSSPRSTACRPPPRRRRSRPRSAPAEGDRRKHAPASAASPATSPPSRLASPAADPAPSVRAFVLLTLENMR